MTNTSHKSSFMSFMADFKKISESLEKHSSIFIFILSSITVFFIYPYLNRYNFYIAVFIVLLYCAFVLFGKNKYVKMFLSSAPVIFVIAFYCFISFSSFYPSKIIPEKNLKTTGFTGQNYYNFLAFSLKNGKLSMPIEPSEKLKALKNPYNPEELNADLSWRKFDYMLDWSFYKGKYYLYFGITPVLTVYLPFLLITKHFISDSLVVLLFAALSFLTALGILKKITHRFLEGEDSFLLNILCVFAVGFSSLFCYLVSWPRVYEAAIISGVFFTLLSFLFILLFFESETKDKKNIMLFFSGSCIALAVGCRPFYAFAVFVQIFIMLDYKNLKNEWKQYLFYLLPLFLCAIILMTYNYARFDSAFQFGSKYQLSIIEIYKWKPSLHEAVSAIVNFFVYPPIYVLNFPYTIANYALVREKLAERVVGILFTAPFLASLFLSFLFFKSKEIAYKYKKYISGMLATGFAVLIIVSPRGSIYRFSAEFCIYFIIPAIASLFYLNVLAKNGIIKISVRYLTMVLLFMSVVFSSAILISLGSEIIKYNNPDLLRKIVLLL